MIKNIHNLTIIFFKNSFQNLNLIDKKKNRINAKSIFVWLIIIVSISISFLSYKLIDVMMMLGKPVIFLNIFFLIINLIIIFQVILASINVYYSTKDIEQFLSLPIKPEELLIAKFSAILTNIYFSELIFALFPLIIYGIFTGANIIYYIHLLIFLVIFPILTILIISIIVILMMKIFKFVKNKDLIQIIIALICIFVVLLLEFKITNSIIAKMDGNITTDNEVIEKSIYDFNGRIENINNYFIIINPIIRVLSNNNEFNNIIEISKIIAINLIFFIVFIFIGKKYYLKNILRNTSYKYNRNKNIVQLEKNIKKSSVAKAYIKKEIITLLKNPIFFIQCIFPILILMISIGILVSAILPNIEALKESQLFGDNIEFKLDITFICLILGFIQMLFMLSNISINSISRDGKNAIYMKFLPVDLYKQIIYKASPQILMNMILIIIILISAKLIFPVLDFFNLMLLFIESNLLNILNSILMVLVDLFRPNINWKSEYEAIKNNNKLFQYALTIINILLLIYLNKILSDINLYLTHSIIIILLFIILILVRIIIKLNINKIYKNIG